MIAEFVQKNIWLVMIAIASGAMFIWPSIAKLINRGREVGVPDAILLINRKDAAIVDVRDAAEFKAGHIPNARNIPQGQIDERMKELEKLKAKPILLVCQAGTRSGAVATALTKAGFGEVVALSGGMSAWQQANMPLEKDS